MDPASRGWGGGCSQPQVKGGPLAGAAEIAGQPGPCPRSDQLPSGYRLCAPEVGFFHAIPKESSVPHLSPACPCKHPSVRILTPRQKKKKKKPRRKNRLEKETRQKRMREEEDRKLTFINTLCVSRTRRGSMYKSSLNLQRQALVTIPTAQPALQGRKQAQRGGVTCLRPPSSRTTEPPPAPGFQMLRAEPSQESNNPQRVQRESRFPRRRRCWEHAVIYRMSCGLSHERRRRPEVKREWEMLGPQFPHLPIREEDSSLRGDGAHEQTAHARGCSAPAAQWVLGWEAG